MNSKMGKILSSLMIDANDLGHRSRRGGMGQGFGIDWKEKLGRPGGTAQGLLERHSTTWAMLPAIFALVTFEIASHVYAQASLDLHPTIYAS
jgi:hypothetical protein